MNKNLRRLKSDSYIHSSPLPIETRSCTARVLLPLIMVLWQSPPREHNRSCVTHIVPQECLASKLSKNAEHTYPWWSSNVDCSHLFSATWQHDVHLLCRHAEENWNSLQQTWRIHCTKTKDGTNDYFSMTVLVPLEQPLSTFVIQFNTLWKLGQSA